MTRLILFCSLIGTILACPYSQANALTLETVLKKVRETHPGIKEGKLAADVAQAKKGTEWLPDPVFTVSFEEVPLSNKSLGNADMTSFAGSQEIPFPSVIATKRKIRDSEFKGAQARSFQTEQKIIFEAKKAYFGLVAARQKQGIQQNLKSAYRQLITASEADYAPSVQQPSNGMGGDRSMSPFPDLMMAKMKEAEAENALFDTRHRIDSLKMRLALMMGEPSVGPHGDMDSLEKTSLPALKKLKTDEAKLEEMLLANNGDLKALRQEIKAAKLEKSLAVQGLLPTIEPELAYERRQNRVNSTTFSVGLNVPLWVNRNSAEIRTAKAAEKMKKAQVDKETIELKAELHYLFHHAQEHYKIVTKFRDEVLKYADAAYKADKAGFEAGNLDNRTYLTRLISVYQTKQEYWDMWEDYQVEYAYLETLIGEEL